MAIWQFDVRALHGRTRCSARAGFGGQETLDRALKLRRNMHELHCVARLNIGIRPVNPSVCSAHAGCLQHNRGMKTAVIPQVRIEPQLRVDLDAVLRDGETLSEFVESAVRAAVEHRLIQSAFAARADVAWARVQRTGAGRPAEDVIADMRARLEARRKELQSKPPPAGA